MLVDTYALTRTKENIFLILKKYLPSCVSSDNDLPVKPSIATLNSVPNGSGFFYKG